MSRLTRQSGIDIILSNWKEESDLYATLSSKGQITIPAALRNSVTALKGLIGSPKKTVTLEEMDAAIGVGG